MRHAASESRISTLSRQSLPDPPSSHVKKGHPEHVAETVRIAPSVARVVPSPGSQPVQGPVTQKGRARQKMWLLIPDKIRVSVKPCRQFASFRRCGLLTSVCLLGSRFSSDVWWGDLKIPDATSHMQDTLKTELYVIAGHRNVDILLPCNCGERLRKSCAECEVGATAYRWTYPASKRPAAM
jgi:hypothetical protein